MAEVAAVGWAISTVGWIVSPITTKLLNHGFALLGFDESEKMRDLEERLLPRLELMRRQAERIPPGHRGLVEKWATKLKSAFYEAEDILDVADYHRLEKQVISQSGTKSAVHRVKQITSRKNRNKKLKKALKKLEDIVEQLLTELAGTITSGSSGNNISDPRNSATRITTTSSVTGFIIGRDKERDEIIRMLRKPTSSNTKCYSVMGIYGIAGSGKTTLAQHVYTFERTEKYFYPTMWVQVNQNFNLDEIYHEMLEAALGEPSRNFRNLDTLRVKLEAALRGKRFLLVLDNVWTAKDDKDEYKLDQLLSPLGVGDAGSNVLLTTRFADAAMYLGCHSPMEIPDLSEIDFFNLFMHYALRDANLDDQESETFNTIGGQIVKKLKRSPLAARVVGARLRKRLNAASWRSLEDRHVWTDTIGVLWWSYQYLDEHVQRCFAYCSLFPQGYLLTRDDLVDLWITEGFIQTTGTIAEMEYIANEYFDELVSCSFLSENKWVTTHDLLHELATMAAGNDCARVDFGEMEQYPPDARHLFIRLNELMEFTKHSFKLKNLRTLIIIRPTITTEELEGMLKKLKKLRVVEVNLQGNIVTIPGCICDLKHLRCFTVAVSFDRSNEIHLPRNFGKLYHLQILKLFGEGILEFSNVQNMSNLISMRLIEASGYDDPSSTTGFPGVGGMKSLQELSDFIVKKKKGYELKQLECLNHLRGRLRIGGLENVESKENALEAKLSDKTSLTALSLTWSISSVPQADLETEIIEGLCPPSELKALVICGFSGLKCPSWLAQNFRILGYLRLEGCVNLESLPDIGELLIHLHELHLVSLLTLKKLPRLPDSLEHLEISFCEDLVMTCVEDVELIRSLFRERVSQIEPSLHIAVHPKEIQRFAQEQPERFDAIVNSIFGCDAFPPKLIQGQITEEDCSQILCPASLNFFNVQCCAITDTVLHNLWRGSTSLNELSIYCLPFFRAIPCEVMKSLSMLQHLRIRDCIQFTCLQGLNYLSNLKSLSIVKCPNLNMILEEAEKVQRLDWWIVVDAISVVPQLLSREGFASLPSLSIEQSDELRQEEILQQFPSLSSLHFTSCKWSSLPENLGALPHLEHLSLGRCPNVRSLPTLPRSLQSFTVRGCDESFMKCCQTAGDPNWQKIAHVRSKEFIQDD